MARVAAGERVMHFETEVLRPDGMPVPHLAVAVPGRPTPSAICRRRWSWPGTSPSNGWPRPPWPRSRCGWRRARPWPMSAAGCGTCGPGRCSGAPSSIGSTASIRCDFDGTFESHLGRVHPEDRERAPGRDGAVGRIGPALSTTSTGSSVPTAKSGSCGCGPSPRWARRGRRSGCAGSVRTSRTGASRPPVVTHQIPDPGDQVAAGVGRRAARRRRWRPARAGCGRPGPVPPATTSANSSVSHSALSDRPSRSRSLPPVLAPIDVADRQGQQDVHRASSSSASAWSRTRTSG